MLLYSSGIEIAPGDSVLIEDGKTSGTVVEVVLTAEEAARWNVDTPGIMIKAAPFGLLFLPESFFQSHSLQFIHRAQP